MIIVLKQHPDQTEVERMLDDLKAQGLKIHYSEGEISTIVGLIGDTAAVDIDRLRTLPCVDTVNRVTEPYKAVNRKFHPADSSVTVNGHGFGDRLFSVVAGPCSVETEEQIVYAARRIQAAGATFLRGGAFKPRTSPYAFQGLGREGLDLLLLAKKATGLPIVTELMSINQLEWFADVDVIQVGARNMQNFELLKELGRCDKPVLLKRGLAATLEELLMSAEYIYAGGNTRVILCERGIRTYERSTRNTLDLSAIPLLKKLSHLPVIVDPSHASGLAELVMPMAKAAVVAGADGLMIEVHPNPKQALCDGAQSLTPDEFDRVMNSVKTLADMENKQM